ncbi:MAG: SPOR domain-containing protein [Methylococcales bacterium]|nr:SPOR domain-containing protein [Methylococcales bacterium]
MTKKQKFKRNGFTAGLNANEDDLILADLNGVLDENDPPPVPLQHFLDDDALIDSLLVDTHFNTNADLEEAGNGRAAMVVDDIDLAEDSDLFGNFVVGPIDAVASPLSADHGGMADIRPGLELFDDEDAAAVESLMVGGFEIGDVGLDDEGPSPLFDGGDEDSGDALGAGQSLQTSPNAKVFAAILDTRADSQVLLDSDLFDEDEALGQDAILPPIEHEEWTDVDGETDDAWEEDVDAEADIQGFVPDGQSFDLDKASSRGTIANPGGQSPFYANPDLGAVADNKPNQRVGIAPVEGGTPTTAKNATLITYAALGLSVVALLSTVGMGLAYFSMQAKVSKLSALVSILEEDMSAVAEKTAQPEISPANAVVDTPVIDNGDASPEAEEGQNLPPEGSGQTGESAIINPDKAVKTVLPALKKPAEPPSKKSQPEKSHPDKRLIKPLQPAQATAKKKQAAVTITPLNDAKQPHKTLLEDKKTSAKDAKKNPSASGWTVNLTAYKDLGYAKSKAGSLQQKGIPVKISTVDMNHTKWYRLQVRGFKDKEKAVSYARKINAAHQLNAVSVPEN